MTLRMLDTFSGIGGFSLAARWLGGIETVQFVEREPYCQRILRKHWSDVPIHDDICTYDPEPGSADIICGGFPCQDISTAGKQAGIKEGTRSGLFYELMRVIRMVGPQYIVLENVAAITSNGLDAVLGTLAEAGYDCEWACIPASAVGACHQRDRWWAVAYPTGQQRNDLRAAWPSRQAKSESGDGNGAVVAGSPGPELLLQMLECRRWADASNPNSLRSRGQDLPLPAVRWSDQGGEVELGAGSGVRAQQGPHWPARNQSLNSDWRSYVSEPVLCRGDDGLSGRVDRLKALGNAVVPQVAMVPLARVLELNEQVG